MMDSYGVLSRLFTRAYCRPSANDNGGQPCTSSK